MNKLKVIVGCEFSGIVTKAFRDLGHEAFSCDLEPTEGNPDWHYQEDIFEVIKREKFDLGIFHPPCTYLTVTGNKWFKPEYKDRFPTREQDRKEAIEFFLRLWNLPIDKICIENPVGIMSTILRKPDQIIQPYQFGHPEPKKTCLWLKNLPLLVHTNIVEPEYFITKSGKRMGTWMYKPSYTPERTKLRNRTFQGIAESFANQWGNL